MVVDSMCGLGNYLVRNKYLIGGLQTRDKGQVPDRHGRVSPSISADIALSPNTSTDERLTHVHVRLDHFEKKFPEDSFQREVAAKLNACTIGKHDAENEVYIDSIIANEKGDKDKALLFIIDELDDEERVQVLFSSLLSRGATPSAHNESHETPLHVAARKQFKGVCKTLLEKGADPYIKNKRKQLPFSIALENDDDAIASMLILYMKDHNVRQLFSSDEKDKADFTLHDLLRSENMEKTVMAVLDSMVRLIGTNGKAKIYFFVLESDEQGRNPDHVFFNPKDRSPFQIIAKRGNKTIINHDVMRLLIQQKWEKYGRNLFLVNAIMFMFTLACLSYAAITAAMTDDPLVYYTAQDYIRAVCEVLSVIAAVTTLFNELYHINKHKLEYFKEKFNYLELASSLFLLALVPLRFTNHNNQWQIYSVVFLLWTLRIFKYAAIFRQTGAYVQILVRVIANDFVQFMVLCTVILLAFSGTLLLALRGESQTDNIADTSTFWAILFLGLRMLIESEKIIEYTDMDAWSCIVMVLFLFCCVVLLLNLLIAQLSDTYQRIQQDAQRGLEANRAWTVARIELRRIFVKQGFRSKHYEKGKEVMDINNMLEKWESPPLQEINKYVQTIEESAETHKLNLLSVTARLARQEQTLIRIQKTLKVLLKRMLLKWPRGSGDFLVKK